MATIQIKRGAAAGLPTLASGEPGWTTDTNALYVGTGAGNVLIGPGAGYTNEEAQDAVGTIMTDSATIDFTYNDGTPSITGSVITQMSVTSDASGVKLSGDSATPGNSKFYGTDAGGTKGWYAQSAVVAAHNSLSGLEGGGGGAYYHLTSADHTTITSVPQAKLLGRKGWSSTGAVEQLSVGSNLDLSALSATVLQAGVRYVQQVAHGFVAGDIVRLSGSTYVKAQADSVANAAVVGVVTDTDTDEFDLMHQPGHVTGLSGLSAGTVYYLSAATAGAMTSTAPTGSGTVARPVFVADSTTSGYYVGGRPDTLAVGTEGYALTLSGGTPAWTTQAVPTPQGRLTLTTATPVTTADVTAAATLYYTPHAGSLVPLYDGTAWRVWRFTERSLSLAGLTVSLPHDVFLYDSSGTLTLEAVAWTNATTRATAVTRQDGVWVKSGATGRLYLGTIYTTATGQTEDSEARRCVWNAYHRVARPLKAIDTTDSWNYTTATWRQARASTANQVDYVCGLSEDPVRATVQVRLSNGTGAAASVGVGVDSTSSNSAQLHGAGATLVAQTATAVYRGYPGVGYHYLAWLEISQAVGTTTWYGDLALSYWSHGMVAEVLA